MNKTLSNLSKSILAGASVISFISALNTDALALAPKTTNSDTDITNGAGFTPAGFNDGDSFSFGDIHTVSFTTNPNRIINIANFDSFDGVMSIAAGINVTTTQVKSNFFPFVGSIIFAGDSTFDGNIGGPGSASIKVISIGNGTANFTGNTFYADEMNLTVAGSVARFSGVNTLIELPISNTSGNDSSGSIEINNDVEFDKAIGASGSRLEKMVFLTDSLVQAQNNDTNPLQITNIYPDAALGTGKGSLLLRYDDDIFDSQDINNDIGLVDYKLKQLSVSSTASESITSEQVANLKANKAIYANTIDIYPYNLSKYSLDQSTLNIETNTIVDAHITTSPPESKIPFFPFFPFGPLDPTPNTVGIVNVQGSSTMTGGIGESGNMMPEVNFTSVNPEDVITFTGDIYAGIIRQESPNLILPQDTLFFVNNDSYHTHNSTHSLGLNTLTIHGSGDMTGTSVFNITADEARAGRVVIDSGNFIMGGAGGLDSMKFNLIGLTTTIPIGGVRSYTVFGTTTGGGTIVIPDNEDVNFEVVSTTNPFMTWTYTNGVITERIKPSAPDDIIDAGSGVTGSARDNLVIIANSDSGVRSDVANAIITGGLEDLLARLQSVITEVTEDSFDIIEDLIGDVSSNLNNKIKINDLRIAEEVSLKGISAGDAAARYGAWMSYSFSDNAQGQRGEKPGYKSRSNGGTIGVDTLISDETALGFAVGYTDTKVNHKDSNIGDTSRAKSILLSLYSITELVNNWYVQGQLVFGRTKIDNTELRGTAARREYARASFHSNAYAASVETGYHFLTENKIMVTPIIGMEFDVIGKSHYQETGTTNQDLNVHKSAQQKLIGHTGIMFAKNIQLGIYNVIPEIYGIVRHDFLNKNLKVKAKLEGVENSLITRTAQNVPTFYNIGLGVTSAIKNTDITLGYDHYFGEKYTSHQGTIKLRLNF